MKTFTRLVGRNVRIFFKDKGVFFTSLISPLILLLLFVTFLGGVYKDSLESIVSQGFTLSDKLIDGFTGGWLMSSLLGVSCVTVAFVANMISVQDKVTGAVGDLTISPVKRTVLAMSYFAANIITTSIVCYSALAVGLVYLGAVGFYMSAADVLLTMADILLLILFGTALSSIINFFLSTQGGITGVSTIVSAAYGFLCGAYMPISQFSDSIRKFITCMPGTYGTGLLRNHMMGGAVEEIGKGMPQELVDTIRDGFDCNLYFFDNKVEIWQMYAVIAAAIVVLVGIFVLLNAVGRKKR